MENSKKHFLLCFGGRSQSSAKGDADEGRGGGLMEEWKFFFTQNMIYNNKTCPNMKVRNHDLRYVLYIFFNKEHDPPSRGGGGSGPAPASSAAVLSV